MANQFQSIQSGLAELKNFYKGPIVDQFSEDVAVWRGSEKMKYNWSGYQVIRPLRVLRNQGIGATSDGGPLPNIGRQGTIQAIIQAKFNYLRFGITGPMIAASQSDIGSFVRSAAYELEEGYKDLKSDVNRQLSWNGNGNLARVNTTVVASTNVSIKGRENTEAALKFISPGIALDIYTALGVVVQQGVTVQSVLTGTANSATATIVFDQAVSAAEDNIFVRANSYGNEIQGLLTQLDGLTTNVFNIDRAAYIQTQGNVINLNNNQLNLDALQQAQDEAERRGGAAINAVYSDFASRRMYYKLLLPDKRYVNTMKGDGGFANKDKTYLAFNEMPWVADKDCPTRIFMLPEKYIEKAVLWEMAFADDTGSQFIAEQDNDQLQVRIRFFANLFNASAAASAAITNYSSP